jgi:serine/threonine protein kinase
MPLKKKIVFQTTFEIYTATEIIGQGGAGYVYRCQDSNGSIFAVKLLNPQKITSDRLKRFENEVTFCRQNNHPNVLKILGDGPHLHGDTSIPFYVMPLYDSSLRYLLNSGIKTDRILPLFSQLLDGVEAAHFKKVLHRDLKPENFLYSASENRIVVADFGIARFQEEELYTAVETKAEDRLANFQYAVPEQRKRGTVTDQRTDIYALGLILNEMFTGEIPQGTGYKTIASVAQEYSYLDELVGFMIRQSPNDRPDSIDVVKQELLARKNEFVQRQQLSQLRNTVIPLTEIDDPLILDPLKIIDHDWGNNILTLTLNHSVNDKWVWALYNMGDYTYRQGIQPRNFSFNGNQAKIPAQEADVQECINYLKSWIPIAALVYRRKLEEEKQAEENRQN